MTTYHRVIVSIEATEFNNCAEAARAVEDACRLFNTQQAAKRLIQCLFVAKVEVQTVNGGNK